jgi:hypothetical protein
MEVCTTLPRQLTLLGSPTLTEISFIALTRSPRWCGPSMTDACSRDGRLVQPECACYSRRSRAHGKRVTATIGPRVILHCRERVAFPFSQRQNLETIK